MRRTEICGIPYDNITLNEIGGTIEQMLREERPHMVYYCNAETVVRARRNTRLRDALNRAQCIFPDGIGMRLFSGLGGTRISERVAGIDVIYVACERAAQLKKSVFLFGSEHGIAAGAAEVLKKKFPALHVTGILDGYDGASRWQENAELKNADMVIVGMGTPLQELWIDEHGTALPHMRVALAVGGAFDMMTGKTPRAPMLFRQFGLEWLWRLFLEPKKRLRRIIDATVVFPLLVIGTRMKQNIKKYFVMGAVLIVACASFGSVPLFAHAQTASSDVPIIFPRSSWENFQGFSAVLDWMPEDKNANTFKDDNPNTNDAIPDYAPVERIVIHDTGCPEASPRCNGNGFDSREVIQSIYRSHAITRGWGDMGYHYIIDRNGIIYEGRYGGNGVRGAHVYNSKTCQNFNSGTIGITLLGNYGSAEVPAATFASLAKLVGWLSTTNGIDAAELSKTTAIWTNPKLNGSCSVSYGGFSSSFTGPVVVGHDDLEKGNPDPGTLNRTLLRDEAKKWQNIYASYIYNAKDDTAVYAVVGGVLQKMGDMIATLSANDQARVVAINPNQLALFPEQNKTTLPDGTLVKSRSRNELFRIDGGKRHHVTSAKLFQRLGYSLANVQIISDRELLGYAKGDPIVFPDGTLLMSENTKKIYLVKSGERRHILSQRVFTQNKFSMKNVIAIPDYELEAYPSGGVVGLPEGTIVSLSKKATAPNHVIMDGGRKIIPSWDMFKKWGFSIKKISIISKTDFDQYPDKGELPYPNGTLVRQEGGAELYLVYQGKKYWIETYETFQKLKLSLAKVIALKANAMEAYPVGGIITAPEDWKMVLSGKQIATKVPSSAPQHLVSLPVVGVAVAPVAPVIPTSGESPLIRIGIFSGGNTDGVIVTATAAFTVKSEKTGERTYQANEKAVVRWQDAGDTRFIPSVKDAVFTVSSYTLFNWNKTVNFNTFRGTLELRYSPYSNKVWMVNELPMDDYIADLGEALNSDNQEYQKAFSIASRSYAMFHLNNGGKYGKTEVFHLNNTSSDQVYRGYAWEAYAPNLVAAARSTAGMVMKYNGKIARAVYSSDTGGVTRNACSYFKGEFCSADYGYLSGGVKDPEGTIRRDAASLAASHGVGMSATGARRLAELGKTYADILGYYYLGISIEKVY